MTPLRSWFVPSGDGLGWMPASREGRMLLATIVAISTILGRVA